MTFDLLRNQGIMNSCRTNHKKRGRTINKRIRILLRLLLAFALIFSAAMGVAATETDTEPEQQPEPEPEPEPVGSLTRLRCPAEDAGG